jgi:hypothetical protein
MKPVLVVCGGLLVMSVSSAWAQGGIDLSWDDCAPFGPANKTFACQSNFGFPFVLYASFEPPSTISDLVGLEAVMSVQSQFGSPLPAWWSFPCENRTIRAEADFLAGPNSCADPWVGTASGGVIEYSISGGRALLVTSFSVPAEGPVAVEPGNDYYAFRVVVPRLATVGSPSCAGCQDGVCVVLSCIRLRRQSGASVFINVPKQRHYASWQSAQNCPPLQWPFDCTPTPIPNSTWGQIKSLYR